MALGCLLACAAPGAWACNAGDTLSLANCVANIAGDSTISLTANITLTGNIGVLAGNATINGNGHTLDGGAAFRGFFVDSGTVSINDLTLQNLKAKGGNGGTESGAGGGGMGAGGALFVRSGAAVTLNNVALAGNSAAGGNGGSDAAGFVRSGGGGGMGGNGAGTAGQGGSDNAGQGGGGLYADGGISFTTTGGTGGGPAGGSGGVAGGGGTGGDYSGGGGTADGTPAKGGTGGFAGGGGGGSNSCLAGGGGGTGGFGGGGGGNACGGAGGTGGFGGGGGAGLSAVGGFGGGTAAGGGGGGAGMGGAVFVMDGASITITGTLTVNGGSVAGGTGGASFGGLSPAGNGSAFGSGIFLQGSGAALTFNPAAGVTQTESDVIADQAGSGGAGSVGLTKNGSGTLVLSANNTYTGTTNINSGVVQIGTNANLGTGSILLNGGELFASETMALSNRTLTVATGATSTIAAAAGKTLSGSLAGINVQANSSLVFGDSANGGTGTVNLSGVAGVISGPFDLKVAAGTLTAGGGAYVNGLTSAATSTTIDSGATLALTSHDAAITKLLGAGTLDTGSSTATLGDGSLFSGVIQGAGNLATAGGATVTLSGANTYGGTTNIAAASTLNLNGSGTLGSGAVTDDGSLVVNRSGPVTVANSISGAGSLTQDGSGTLILTGNNIYTGATNISAGTLQINAASALQSTSGISMTGGRLLAGGSFTLDRHLLVETGATAEIAAAAGQTLLYTGSLTQQGNSTLVVGDATNTGTIVMTPVSFGFTAGAALHVAGGTLTDTTTRPLSIVTSLDASTTVDGGSTLAFTGAGAIKNLQGADSTATVSSVGGLTLQAGSFAGAISGGALTVNTGTVLLTGSNTYSGGTTISSGTLQIGNGGGTGTLGSGNVTDNGSLVINRSGPVTVAGNISGAGNLTQAGTGNLVLTGNSSAFTGATAVNSGTLSVNGQLGGFLSVNSGGILGGNGTVGATTIASGATLAPGNSIGTLNTGPLTIAAGSTYNVEVTSSAADRTNVAGALTINGGTVNVLAGGSGYARNTQYTILTNTGAQSGAFAGVNSNLAFLTPTLSYTANSVLLNLASSNALSYGSVAGTANQGNVAGALNNVLTQGGSALTNQIDNLTAGQARTAFDSLSGAQFAAASQTGLAMSRAFGDGVNGHLGSSGGGSGGNGNAGFNGIGAIKGAALAFSSPVTPWGVSGDTPTQLAGMMGTGAGGMASSAFNPTAYNSAAYNGNAADNGNPGSYGSETGRAASGDGATLGPAAWAPNPAGQNGLWSQALGTTGRMQSDGNGAGSSYSGGGFMVGVDHAVSDRWLIGAAGGYSRAHWNASLNGTSPASGTVQTPQGALYARYTSGPWLLSLSGGYADHKFDTSRSVVIGPSTTNASSSHHGGEWSTDAQVEYSLASGAWQVRPLLGVRYSHLREDAFNESGAGNANLSLDARTTQSTTISAGARVLRAFTDNTGGYEFKAVYSHLFGDNDSPVSARLAGQSAVFTAAGTPLQRDALTLSAGIGATLAHNVSGFVEVKAEERGHGQEAYAVGGGLRLVW